MLTEQQWKELEEKVRPPSGESVSLKIDNYNVSIEPRLYTKKGFVYKFCLTVFIDGKCKQEWMMNDCEERRRFFNLQKRPLYTGKKRSILKQIDSKSKRCNKFHKNLYDRTFDLYNPAWFSFKALKKHLIANNKEINLV